MRTSAHMAVQCLPPENGIARLHPAGLHRLDAGGAHAGGAAASSLGREARLQQPVDHHHHRFRPGAAAQSRIETSLGRVARLAQRAGEGKRMAELCISITRV